jgi:hypothetical protein
MLLEKFFEIGEKKRAVNQKRPSARMAYRKVSNEWKWAGY